MIPSDPSLAESETLKDALLARLATEVRHTLHHVLGSIELASEEPLSREQTRYLGRCRESAHELLRIANDVSELADSGAFTETPSRFEPSELLEGFKNLIGIRATRKDLTLRWSVDRQVPRAVLGFRQAVEMVLYRLVDNAIKFTERGEIALFARFNSLDERSSEIVIEVSDTGPGIDRSVLDDLDRPIEQSGNKGLGLRLARKQLAEIGGHLDVVRADDQGSMVAIVFPVTVSSTAASTGDVLEKDPSEAKLRLLVEEDSDDSFAVFEAFVKDEGHVVTRAVDGAQAVDLFKHGVFDVVVMDVNMPVMDGYTATSMIRGWETIQGRARLPILLLSADDPGRQMCIGSAAGCSGYLTKPTPKRELLCALRHYSPLAI
jgi:CheY-like chemotaxis protein